MTSNNTIVNNVAGASTAVLMVHGIAEAAHAMNEFVPVFERLGYSTAAITLPGHGGSMKDFAGASLSLWQEAVAQATDELRSNYDHIILLGRSMGALLVLNESARCNEKIQAVIAIATPLKVNVTCKAITNNIKIGFKVKTTSPDVLSMIDKMGVEQGNWWQYASWLPRIADLFRLISITKHQLPAITVPVLAIHCQHDELVSPKSLTMLQQHLSSATTIILPTSSHFHFSPTDFATLQQSIQQLPLQAQNTTA
ncbi:MAG: alpha/beta fold hydrolase [Muribaculaceae bacterium]|nr:alpha/beta fold hydrolase [Muribaculaceae bacterium]